VHARYIDTVFVSSHEVADELRNRTRKGIEIIPHPYLFFQPHPDIELTKNLHVVDGDMFFSRMQTLTVSVNIQGVMGKGLASRAKYQFPDVYVRYQDVCRSKSILMGKPYLYKRESSLDYDLADEPNSLKNANSQTWFLLFATKRHWWDMADFEGIARGLRWIRENYQKENIKGLAIPALGCGLGRLEWKDIGPLICHHLSDLTIPVQVYLPAEKQIPAKYLTKEFLLSASGAS
jgi:O-acetyl-ADP-ribose deacetylase (regulator of RNase III)